MNEHIQRKENFHMTYKFYHEISLRFIQGYIDITISYLFFSLYI